MPISTLSYDGRCDVKLIVDVHGTELPLTALVDSGFTSGTGFGLKLPNAFASHANYTGTGCVQVADGRQIATETIPDAKIVQIEGHRLNEKVTVPAIFMDGSHGAIGVLFLQLCNLELNGPIRTATIRF